MIYEIDNKIYIKMENYYSEVELKSGRLVPVKNRKKLYFSDVSKGKIKEYTVDEVFAEVIKDRAFYETSGGGVTFSGGECMLQIDFLLDILKKCKENGIHTAVDTAGYISFESFEKILPYSDLFLYDIKCFDNEKHKKYVGVENELILENLKKLFHANAKIWIRRVCWCKRKCWLLHECWYCKRYSFVKKLSSCKPKSLAKK